MIQNEIAWVLPAGQIQHLRAYWAEPESPLYSGEYMQGFIELEDFSDNIKQVFVRLIRTKLDRQRMVIDNIPVASSFWAIPPYWSDERQYNRQGQEVNRITRQPLFNLQVQLEKMKYV